jgi:mannose-6-phosphate isomerase-like protein (cupin superfamily)
MKEEVSYAIRLDSKFGFLELIDVPALIAACEEPWYNQTLCEVNDCAFRLGLMQGEFHWHKHDEEDEFSFVLQGKLLIDLESGTITLGPHQGYTIPRGVMHRTRAPERSAILMVEGSGVKPTGDCDPSEEDPDECRKANPPPGLHPHDPGQRAQWP